MTNENKIKFKESVRFQVGKDQTLVANTDNTECMFISNECIDMINEAIENNLTKDELLSIIEDIESRQYMDKLFEKLEEMYMFNIGTNEDISNSQIQIGIGITNNCNLRCKHCNVSAGEEKRGKELGTNEIMIVLKKITELQPFSITISGGEPLVREDFKEITKFIRSKYDGNLSLMTNGTLINDEIADFISKHYNSVDISIDGIDEDTCSLIRGKGAFEKAVNGIKLLQKNNCNAIAGSMLLTKHTEKYKEEFNFLCRNELHIEPMMRKFDKNGRGEEFAEEIEIENKVDSNKIREDFIKNGKYKRKPPIFACQGAKREFQIDHKGDIFPCASMTYEEFKLGNVLEIDNLSLFFEKKLFKFAEGYLNFTGYFPYNIDKCKNCNKNLLCFSCTSEIRNCLKNNSFNEVCSENRECFDLYWDRSNIKE